GQRPGSLARRRSKRGGFSISRRPGGVDGQPHPDLSWLGFPRNFGSSVCEFFLVTESPLILALASVPKPDSLWLLSRILYSFLLEGICLLLIVWTKYWTESARLLILRRLPIGGDAGAVAIRIVPGVQSMSAATAN